jgi:C-terminal processing protease CtpA/Prc
LPKTNLCRDYIVAVNGELVGGKSLSQLAELILGAPDSCVECSFKSKVSQELYNVSLNRGTTAPQ